MKRLKFILRWILLAGCLIYLVGFFYRHSASLEIAFALDAKLLTAILALQPFLYLLQSWRFQIVMEKCTGVRLPFLPWFRIHILARFLNTVFSQMGNVYRGLILKRDYGITYTKYIGGHTSMTWLDTALNLILALVIVLVVQPDFQIGRVLAWPALAVLVVLVVALPVTCGWLLGAFSFKNRGLDWTHQRLQQVVAITQSNLNDPAYWGKLFVLGVFQFVRTCITFYLYFLCFDIQVDLATLAVFYAVFKLGILVTLTPGNLGVQEIVWGVLGENMGIGMAQGVLVSMLIRVVGTSFLLVLGLTVGGTNLLQHRSLYVMNSAE